MLAESKRADLPRRAGGAGDVVGRALLLSGDRLGHLRGCAIFVKRNGSGQIAARLPFVVVPDWALRRHPDRDPALHTLDLAFGIAVAIRGVGARDVVGTLQDGQGQAAEGSGDII